MENKKTIMRVDKELLKEISKIKHYKKNSRVKESYASVIKRLIDSERRGK